MAKTARKKKLEKRPRKDNRFLIIKEECLRVLQDQEAAMIIQKHFDTLLATGSYQYIDRMRVAEQLDLIQVEKYKETKMLGCCGFYDKRIEANGKTYLFGFNYGH
jgi:hypothetical protein